MLALRWLEGHGGTTKSIVDIASFELDPQKQVSVEAVLGLTSRFWRANYGLLVDTNKTNLVAGWEDDVNSHYGDDGELVPYEYCEDFDHVTEWDQIEPMMARIGELRCVECFVERPVYKAVVVLDKYKNDCEYAWRSFDNDQGLTVLEKAHIVADILGVPVYISSVLRNPHSIDNEVWVDKLVKRLENRGVSEKTMQYLQILL